MRALAVTSFTPRSSQRHVTGTDTSLCHRRTEHRPQPPPLHLHFHFLKDQSLQPAGHFNHPRIQTGNSVSSVPEGLWSRQTRAEASLGGHPAPFCTVCVGRRRKEKTQPSVGKKPQITVSLWQKRATGERSKSKASVGGPQGQGEFKTMPKLLCPRPGLTEAKVERGGDSPALRGCFS